VHQVAHGLDVGDVVRLSGTSYVKAQADSEANAEAIGIVSAVAGADDFTLAKEGGRVTGLTGLVAGTVYFLSEATAGLLTATEPSGVGEVTKPMLVADTTTSGHVVGMRGIVVPDSGAAGGWPIREFIVGYHRPKAESNFDNVTPPDGGSANGIIPFGTRFSDNADGAWVEWFVALAAGTYALNVKGWPYNGSGILVFSLDGTDIDAAPYNASSAAYDTYANPGGAYTPAFEVCADLVIPASGIYTLRATVTGKNASSSGFATNVVYVELNKQS